MSVPDVCRQGRLEPSSPCVPRLAKTGHSFRTRACQSPGNFGEPPQGLLQALDPHGICVSTHRGDAAPSMCVPGCAGAAPHNSCLPRSLAGPWGSRDRSWPSRLCSQTCGTKAHRQMFLGKGRCNEMFQGLKSQGCFLGAPAGPHPPQPLGSHSAQWESSALSATPFLNRTPKADFVAESLVQK